MWALAPSLLAGGALVGPDYPSLVLQSRPVQYWRLCDDVGTVATNLVPGGTVGTYSAAPNTYSYSLNGPVTGGGYMWADAGATQTGMNTGVATDYTTALTVEFFFYAEASQPDSAGQIHMISKSEYYASANSTFPFKVIWDHANTRVSFVLSKGDDFQADTTLNSGTLTTGKWYHCAAVYRASGSCELYIDGVQVAQSTINYTISSSGAITWRVGHSAEYSSGAGLTSFNGRMAEVAFFNRALSGTEIAKHIAGKPKSRDGYRGKTVTSLPMQLGESTTEIIDFAQTLRSQWGVTGNAAISATQSRSGGYSLALDGNGDNIWRRVTEDDDLSGNTYTIEAWIYPTSVSGVDPIYNLSATNVGAFGYLSLHLSSGVLNLVVRPTTGGAETYVTGGLCVANAWQHVAASVDEGVATLWLDGVMVAKGTITALAKTTPVWVAVGTWANSYDSANSAFAGYIDDLRVTVGVARYKSEPYTQAAAPDDITGTVSLLQFEGANGSTTITDAKGRTWTAQGNAQISTAQSRFGSSSLVLDGTGDWIEATAHADFNFGTSGDFYMEGWFCLASYSASPYLFHIWSNAANRTAMQLSNPGCTLDFYSSATTVQTGKVVPFQANTWVHVAWARVGSMTYFFWDGACVYMGQPSYHTTWGDTKIYIGAAQPTASANYITGNVDGVRILKGQAARHLWARMAPPAALHGYDPYFDNVKALLTGNGVSTTARARNDIKNENWTVNGNVAVWNTSSRFNGASIWFDGTGDYVDSPVHADYTLGTDAFTIEAWVRPTDSVSGRYNAVFDNRINGTGLGLYVGGSAPADQNKLVLSDNTAVAAQGGTVALNTWQHIALQRSGTSVTGWVNGLKAFEYTDSRSYDSTYWRLGRDSVDTNALIGYMDEVRFTRGVARYPLTFTPPADTMALAMGDVTVLNFDGTHGATSTTDLGGLTWTFNGNAALSNVQVKQGTTSLALDGNGDYLSASNAKLACGTGDFTVEGWFYRVGTGTQTLFDFRTSGAVSATGWVLYWYHTGNNLDMYSNVALLTNGPPLAQNTWTHVAVVRHNGFFCVYVNGVCERRFANTTNFTDAVCRIGSAGTDGFNGYVDRFRISRFARYALPFPVAPFPRLKGP